MKCTGNSTRGKGPRDYLNPSLVTQLAHSEVHPLRKLRVGQINSAAQILLTALCSPFCLHNEMLQTTSQHTLLSPYNKLH